MKTKRHLTCIVCPKGCQITVELEDGQVVSITGNTCKNGEKYAREEIIAPKRTVTSLIRISGGALPVVSVKTRTEIPKEKIMDCMAVIRKARATAPVHMGDVLISNVAGTGVDVVATKNINGGAGLKVSLEEGVLLNGSD